MRNDETLQVPRLDEEVQHMALAPVAADEQDSDTDNHRALPSSTCSGPTEADDFTADPGTAPDERIGRQDVAKTIATLAGNVLESFDFAVFGYFSDVIGDVFFPPNQKGHASIVGAFAVFGGAFLMRPLGGILVGHMADTYGRKKALVWSMSSMALATFLMGCLPTFGQVGHWAIVGLACLRLLQGLSFGGQLLSVLVYYCELHPPSAWGYYGAQVSVSSGIGGIVGSMVGALLRQVLTQAELESWGWRIPFWSGCLVALSSIYVRSACEESQVALVSQDDRPPLRQALESRNLRSIMAATLVSMVISTGFYLYFVWMATFMNNLMDPPVPHAFAVNTVAVLISTLCFPLAGALSDEFGRVPTMTVAGLLMALLAYPMMSVIDRAKGRMWTACLAQSVLGISLAFWIGPMGAWMVECFEPQVRVTSVAIAYNTAEALVGGFSPMIATILVDRWGPLALALYVSVFAVLGLAGLWWVAPEKATLSSSSSATRDETMIVGESSIPTEESLRSPLLPSVPNLRPQQDDGVNDEVGRD